MNEKRKVTTQLIAGELVFTSSRSGGPGGQNVNKVNTKVTLSFELFSSTILTEEEKNTITQKLSGHISKEGILQISASEKRSQLHNKVIAINKLDKLLAKAFIIPKPRKSTKPTKSSVKERLEKKKIISEKKKNRKRLD